MASSSPARALGFPSAFMRICKQVHAHAGHFCWPLVRQPSGDSDVLVRPQCCHVSKWGRAIGATTRRVGARDPTMRWPPPLLVLWPRTAQDRDRVLLHARRNSAEARSSSSSPAHQAQMEVCLHRCRRSPMFASLFSGAPRHCASTPPINTHPLRPDLGGGGGTSEPNSKWSARSRNPAPCSASACRGFGWFPCLLTCC